MTHYTGEPAWLPLLIDLTGVTGPALEVGETLGLRRPFICIFIDSRFCLTWS